MVFAPHVETSAGMILPDDYLRAVADAVHDVGGLFVLDCIAIGLRLGRHEGDGRRCADLGAAKGLVGVAVGGAGDAVRGGLARAKATQSTSFAVDLGKWLSIMEAYEAGGHAYHATMPTDALRAFRDTMLETREYGFARLKDAQWEQGDRVRASLAKRGIKSVAADGFAAPGVVVSYTSDPEVQIGQEVRGPGHADRGGGAAAMR